MTKRIFYSIFISAIAVLFVSFAATFCFFYDYYDKQIRNELRIEADYVGACVDKYGADFLRDLPATEMRLTLVDGEGTVIFDSHLNDSDTLEMQNHADREEIALAMSEGEGYSSRYSDTLSTTYVYYARKIGANMILRVSIGHVSVPSMLLRFLLPLSAITLIIAAAVFLIARKISAKIVRPINEMNLTNPYGNKVYDELKPLAKKITSQSHRIARQVAEARVRESELESITANMNEGMIIINSRAAILACNESARRIYGLREIPKSVLAIDDSHSFREAIDSALSGKRYSCGIKTEEKHYGIIATPVLNDGVVDGAVIMIIDDTEKEEREALRREFTSNVSHELKTPLTSISGYSELISCGMADGEDARRFAKSIKHESDRLVSLVGDIIKLTQLEGGEIPYDGEISLADAADDVAKRLAVIADSAGVTLKTRIEPAPVLGNAKILGEMIYNLVDNAIKYNKSGGEVEIACEDTPSGARLTVSDTGIGIPKDVQDRVFERFYRVDKSHSSKIGGTGLGLSIVKHAALYHKAQISLSSELGAGTKITVSFPKI